MTAFAFASSPDVVPRPKCSIDFNINTPAMEFQAVQVATVDVECLAPLGEKVLSYQSYLLRLPALKSIALKVQISDYGNYLYRHYNSDKHLKPTKSKSDPILELDRLLVRQSKGISNSSHELNC